MDGTDVARVALLVDGDNLSGALAGQMIVAAARLGRVTVKRVYLRQEHQKGWAGAEGFRFMSAPPGKNATDLALCIDAMDLAHDQPDMAFALASSDRDFSWLALNLVEKGRVVLGLGEAKAPGHFRKSCTRFEELKPVAAKPAPMPVLSENDKSLVDLIAEHGTNGRISLCVLGHRASQALGGKPKDKLGAQLKTYLKQRPALFTVEIDDWVAARV